MRAKRSKQYKKLVQQFQLHHGFREPYQVLGKYLGVTSLCVSFANCCFFFSFFFFFLVAP